MLINAYAERLSAALILSLIGWSRTYSTLIFVLYSVILTAVRITFSLKVLTVRPMESPWL